MRFSPWRGLVRMLLTLLKGLQNLLFDANRYVRGDAVHALYRIGTPAAKAVLLRYLETTRWCPVTSKESTVLGNVCDISGIRCG